MKSILCWSFKLNQFKFSTIRTANRPKTERIHTQSIGFAQFRCVRVCVCVCIKNGYRFSPDFKLQSHLNRANTVCHVKLNKSTNDKYGKMSSAILSTQSHLFSVECHVNKVTTWFSLYLENLDIFWKEIDRFIALKSIHWKPKEKEKKITFNG